MAFIKYQKEQQPVSQYKNTIGINHKGQFVFYKSVVQNYLNNVRYVELLFDPEEQKIGILLLNKVTENAIRIHGKTTKMIIAKKFLKKFNINIKDKRYEFKSDDNEQMLIIKI
jgi:hypothetical protein